MPTYQYRCNDCGEDLEVKQSFSEDALTTCPACGGALRKVFGAAGVVFKGSGFYRNDSRTTTQPSSGSTSGDSASSSSTTTATPASSSGSSGTD